MPTRFLLRLLVCIVIIFTVTQPALAGQSSTVNQDENPGPFLVWPLADTNLQNILRLPDTAWTRHFLGVVGCGTYPSLLDAGPWTRDGITKYYPGNRHLILPDISDNRVKWLNANRGGEFNNAFGCYKGHEGTDISQGDGTRVLAAASGYIHKISGYRYTIRHENVNNTGQTWYTAYVHVTNMRFDIGTYVEAGTWIADVGENHLHFELFYGGAYSGNIRNPWGRDVAAWDGCMWKDSAACNAVGIYNETINDQAGGANTGHFPDVALNHPSYPYIETLYSLKAVGGFSDGTYRPDNYITRGEIAIVIIRAIGKYREYNDGQCAFTDVCPGNSAYHFIRRLKELGITSGFSDGTYRPNDYLARAGAAAFIVNARFEGKPSYSCNPHFPDVLCSNTFYHYIEKLYRIFTSKGYSLGYSDGTFRPDEFITRGGVAKLIVIGLDLESHIPRFYDVLHDNRFYSYIDAIASRKITSGCQTSPYPLYCPADMITRGQVAKFIIRGLGETPRYTDGRQTFPDVPSTHTFYHDIERLYEKGIIRGFSDGTYRPDSYVTRAEIAVMIINGLGEATTYSDNKQIFSDVPVTNKFYHFIRRLYELDITSGYSDGTYQPNAPISREQTAKFIALAFIYRAPAVNQENDEKINNSWVTAPTYANQTFQVVPGNDVDFIRLNIPAADAVVGGGGTTAPSYQIAVEGTGANADIRIDIYASNGTTLLSSISGKGTQGTIGLYWTPAQSGTYYVRLSNTNPYAVDGVYMNFTVSPITLQRMYLPAVVK